MSSPTQEGVHKSEQPVIADKESGGSNDSPISGVMDRYREFGMWNRLHVRDVFKDIKEKGLYKALRSKMHISNLSYCFYCYA